mmetsp:Transcript_98588/g.274312  ORF Transcript_98588/g.274312 Transcript_98588/m.274312 type:complete len:328 (+) Transcript_98588:186-1169(+)
MGQGPGKRHPTCQQKVKKLSGTATPHHSGCLCTVEQTPEIPREPRVHDCDRGHAQGHPDLSHGLLRLQGRLCNATHAAGRCLRRVLCAAAVQLTQEPVDLRDLAGDLALVRALLLAHLPERNCDLADAGAGQKLRELRVVEHLVKEPLPGLAAAYGLLELGPNSQGQCDGVRRALIHRPVFDIVSPVHSALLALHRALGHGHLVALVASIASPALAVLCALLRPVLQVRGHGTLIPGRLPRLSFRGADAVDVHAGVLDGNRIHVLRAMPVCAAVPGHLAALAAGGSALDLGLFAPINVRRHRNDIKHAHGAGRPLRGRKTAGPRVLP